MVTDTNKVYFVEAQTKDQIGNVFTVVSGILGEEYEDRTVYDDHADATMETRDYELISISARDMGNEDKVVGGLLGAKIENRNENGKVIGDGSLIWLEYIGLEPEYRGHGIGSGMLEKMIGISNRIGGSALQQISAQARLADGDYRGSRAFFEHNDYRRVPIGAIFPCYDFDLETGKPEDEPDKFDWMINLVNGTNYVSNSMLETAINTIYYHWAWPNREDFDVSGKIFRKITRYIEGIGDEMHEKLEELDKQIKLEDPLKFEKPTRVA